MFIKPFKRSAMAFRDTFRVDLDFELYGQYKNASDVIDAVFNLEQVIVADPRRASNGYPPREEWITILVENGLQFL